MAATLEALRMQLAAMETRQTKHEAECLTVRRETKDAIGLVTKEIADFKQLPMKAVRWIGGIVVMAAVTQLVVGYMNNQAATEKVDKAALSAQQAASGVQQANGKLSAIQAAQTNATAP